MTEEQSFVEYFIKKYYNFRNKTGIGYTVAEPINLIIRPECNQKCAYCYITQYGDKLYPKEERANKNTILKNLKLILEWLINNKVAPNTFELFAGDLFHDNLLYEILDVFIDMYSNISDYPYPIHIIVPTNAYFLQFENYQKQTLNYIDKCQQAKISLAFSISTDGLYAIDSRENVTYNLDQSYYDTLFNFLSTIKAEMHPMISAENINNQKQNLEWWIQMFKKYKLSTYNIQFPSFLEVRNPNWTKNELQQLEEFLKFFLLTRLQLENNSIDQLTQTLFCSSSYYPFYDICRLNWKNSDTALSCAMAYEFSINVATLALPICHRLTYPEFNLGHFIIENNQINGILPSEKYSTHIQLKTIPPKFYPKCNSCMYKHLCIKGCLGAQYEYSGEVLMPIPSVCALEQVKINTLLKEYNKIGILDCALKNNYIQNKEFENFIKQYKNNDFIRKE